MHREGGNDPEFFDANGPLTGLKRSLTDGGIRDLQRIYEIECNWKVYVDNYLEGYHIPIAHPDLFKELDYDAYRVETFRYHSKSYAPIRDLVRAINDAPAGDLTQALAEHLMQQDAR